MGSLIANSGGISNDLSPGNGMTGLVVAVGNEKPLALSSLIVIVLFITNIITLFLFLAEKGKHMKDR